MADLLTEAAAAGQVARYGRARQEVSSAVNRIVATEHGKEGFERRDLYPGASNRSDGTPSKVAELWFDNHPKPEPHLLAVTALYAAAAEEERRAIDNARGQGLTWAAIAEALGLAEAAKREDQSLELAGWRYAAMHVRPGEPDPEWAWGGYGRGSTADWRCWTCHGTVSEGHPDNGVEDAEKGHQNGCALYAAEVTKQRAPWGDEG